MESTHVISITDNVAPRKNTTKTFKFSLPPVFSRLRENKIHLWDKQMKDAKKIIHSIKVGISLVLISLLYLLDPLYEQVGENAIWAIMTVVVTFEFSAGATLGKGLNRGMGTILGGGLGCMAAVLAQNIGGVGNSIIIGASVFIFGTIATYFRLFPSVKKRYDYGVMIFILTFSLIVVSGVRTEDQKVWEIAVERLLTIVMGFVVCICVSFLIFPLWASDELHDSIVSRFQHIANSLQGCMEEYVKFVSEKENKKPGASFSVCKSLLDSKSKDEVLANFAKWEPWHGKFGFFYPWEKYLKIGDVLRELAAITLALGGCFQASETAMKMEAVSESVEREACEAIGSGIVWSLQELGESMKQMRKCEADISEMLKTVREEISLVISTSKMAAIDNMDAVAVASFVFLLKKVVEKVEELTKEVEQLGDLAAFPAHSTLV
ncbi:Aluminum-activated malate transporter [Vigna unguiculata]|uniref:Aluminum-activated malate transporter n=1 Tax=Vigna unguiculata TaxID=3917 RepID=A0A4D6LE49_VIGUN|nr:Aluminum-activated malate transporter [Vigna unguiculata]